MIALVKPDVVFLELCNLRTRLLITDEKNIMAEYEKELSTTEILESLKKVWAFDSVSSKLFSDMSFRDNYWLSCSE